MSFTVQSKRRQISPGNGCEPHFQSEIAFAAVFNSARCEHNLYSPVVNLRTNLIVAKS